MRNFVLISSFTLLLLLTACSEIKPKPFTPSSLHIKNETSIAGDIPELLTQIPILPTPTHIGELEKYTVIVNEVPVRELLFALARDAQVNVDIDPTIEGVVIINAVEQTLFQILDRIARQVNLRYELSAGNLYIQADIPFLKIYVIDYVNISRKMKSTNTIATQITSSGGGNNSTMDVSSVSNHNFWGNLISGISAILGENSSSSNGSIAITETVISNPESGIIAIKATALQHTNIQEFIDNVVDSAKRQVLVRATIVEVTLNDKYQAGIDWSLLNKSGAGISITSNTLSGTTLVPTLLSSFAITAVDPDIVGDQSLRATINLLDEFGETKVLSSPQIMTLNNQTAILKVVQNFVYFDIDAKIVPKKDGTDPIVTVDTTAKTIPVGIVMTVTPQIDASGVITLNVRPTISRVVGTVFDPAPSIFTLLRSTAGATIVPPSNPVPIISVQEMESILRLNNGQIGILGGLMTDIIVNNEAGLPGIKEQPFWGNFFKSNSAQYTKTELVIFLRPVIINDPSVNADLSNYKQYLHKGNEFLPEPK